MYKLLGVIIAFLSIGGCSTSQLTVREDSVIPDILLSEAYQYTEVCIANGADELGREAILQNETLDVEELAIIEDCMDSMFILYANTRYTVLDKNENGRFVSVCTSTDIEGINDCLSI